MRKTKFQILMGLPGDLVDDLADLLNCEPWQLIYILPALIGLSYGFLFGIPWLLYWMSGVM